MEETAILPKSGGNTANFAKPFAMWSVEGNCKRKVHPKCVQAENREPQRSMNSYHLLKHSGEMP